MKDTRQTKWNSFLAPLYVLKEEKLYYIWFIFVVFFGLLNVWAGLLLLWPHEISAALQEGIVYTYSVSICAPLLAEDFVKQIVNKRKGKNPDFVFYHVMTSAINIIWILVLVFLWLGGLRSKIWLQIACGVISSLFAFYMYCVEQMEQHKLALKEYDDTEYPDVERSRMDMTKEGVLAADKIEDGENPRYVLRQYFIKERDDVILKNVMNDFGAAASVFPGEWEQSYLAEWFRKGL